MSEDILLISAATRAACERYNEKYNQFWQGLGGMCGLASHFLFRNLTAQGYSPVFHLAENAHGHGVHCWVEVDGVHVDITATQFDYWDKVMTFRGEPHEHPALKKFFGFKFPTGWTFQSANTSGGVKKLMSDWQDCEQYAGRVRQSINKFY